MEALQRVLAQRLPVRAMRFSGGGERPFSWLETASFERRNMEREREGEGCFSRLRTAGLLAREEEEGSTRSLSFRCYLSLSNCRLSKQRDKRGVVSGGKVRFNEGSSSRFLVVFFARSLVRYTLLALRWSARSPAGNPLCHVSLPG